jgi:very-short-patch-repair endonuclease
MDRKTRQPMTWARVRAQFGVISRVQLLAYGWSSDEIEHRRESGRLHRLFRGVYAVGRPDVTREGWWMAAILACGDGSVLSHRTAATHLGLLKGPTGPVHVSVPLTTRRSHAGIRPHRRSLQASDVTVREGIPVTTPATTIADLATGMRRGPLEGVINQADILGLVRVPDLRAAVEEMPPRPGKRALCETIDRRTFRFTRSQLERAFIPLALSAGLPRPETCVVVNGWEVDFYWPELDFVVEADSLTYHRTAAQQHRDRLRDQAHAVAETERLRVTHSQIRYEPGYVRALLATVARRLLRKVGRELQQLGHG